MALTVPDIQNITNGTNGFDFQTVWDQQDFAALSNGHACGVYYGCNVVPLATPGYSASVDPGYVTITGNAPITVAGGSVAIAAASSTDRRDIIVVNSAGGIGVVQGTACGTAGWVRTTNALAPVKPSFGGSVMVGEMGVPGGSASVTAMNASCIVDKRVMLIPSPLAVANVNHANYTTNGSTLAAIDSTNLTLTFVAPPSGRVRLRATGVYGMGTAAISILMGWVNHGLSTVFTGSVNMNFEVGTTAVRIPVTYEQVVTGLTYGTSYSVDLAWAVSTGGDTATLYASSNTATTGSTTQAGPVHLVAEAA